MSRLSFFQTFKWSFLVHLSAVLILLLMPTAYVEKKQRVKVQTVRIGKVAPVNGAIAAKKESPKGEIKKEKPAPKKEKVAAPKEKPAATKETPKKSAPKNSDLKKVQESVAKIEKIDTGNISKESYSTTTLKPIDSLQFTGEMGQEGYVEELTKRLKMQMQLPEYGQVELDLTLLRSGKVESIKISNSKSLLNRKYLEKALLEISFPPFGKSYENDEKHTFTLTLSNEIS